MEEIYPPKIQEFAYVTDGACTEADILSKELAIMKVMQSVWLRPPTLPVPCPFYSDTMFL